ncbi:MAG: LamG domain-containing protein [Lacunisphaera sp.]|nr:LamG domain-containing protein [Lacunisphaera sp.]
MLLLRSAFLAILGLLAAGRLSAAAPAATHWRLDRTDQVGGHRTEVLGAPQVVAGPGGPAVQFNGTSDGLYVPDNPLAHCLAFTLEALIRPDADGPAEQRFLHVQDEAGSRALLELRLTDRGWALDTFLFSATTQTKLALLDRARLHPAERWTWVALVYANGHMAHYIDGVKELEGDVVMPPLGTGRISLGVRQNKVSWFKGRIREVRFHPTALAPAALQQVLESDR